MVAALVVVVVGGGALLWRWLVGEETGEPVIATDFPDPFVLHVSEGIENVYYAFATDDGDDNLQLRRSTDLFDWSRESDPLPDLPSWASSGETWGPSVHRFGDRYVLYFSATDTADRTECIGTAVSRHPTGPYRPAGTSAGSSSKPLVCQSEQGGSIDPAVYVDGDDRWLVWKNDGDSNGSPVALWSRRLTDDGLGFASGSEPNKILEPDESWQADLIEAPDFVEADGTLYLFYSANHYATSKYAIGYATCEHPAGPCTNQSKRPFVRSRGNVRGPGGEDVFVDALGDRWIVFHAWKKGAVGYDNGGRRAMYLDRITFHADREPSTDAPIGVTRD
ncbi:MAG: glycoside hydrolase family 43 protein [Acidimicrobiia bacterium]|nr:glycoside hydrolase family 43 protein [Acidimicrobiia bacterium]